MLRGFHDEAQEDGNAVAGAIGVPQRERQSKRKKKHQVHQSIRNAPIATDQTRRETRRRSALWDERYEGNDTNPESKVLQYGANGSERREVYSDFLQLHQVVSQSWQEFIPRSCVISLMSSPFRGIYL